MKINCMLFFALNLVSNWYRPLIACFFHLRSHLTCLSLSYFLIDICYDNPIVGTIAPLPQLPHFQFSLPNG